MVPQKNLPSLIYYGESWICQIAIHLDIPPAHIPKSTFTNKVFVWILDLLFSFQSQMPFKQPCKYIREYIHSNYFGLLGLVYSLGHEKPP